MKVIREKRNFNANCLRHRMPACPEGISPVYKPSINPANNSLPSVRYFRNEQFLWPWLLFCTWDFQVARYWNNDPSEFLTHQTNLQHVHKSQHILQYLKSRAINVSRTFIVSIIIFQFLRQCFVNQYQKRRVFTARTFPPCLLQFPFLHTSFSKVNVIDLRSGGLFNIVPSLHNINISTREWNSFPTIKHMLHSLDCICVGLNQLFIYPMWHNLQGWNSMICF